MPRHLFESLIPKVETRWEVIRLHILPFIGVVAIFMALYFASGHISVGWITWTISSAALFIIGLTALARVNDIAHTQTSARWQVRRLGLILAGAACLGIILSPWIATPKDGAVDFPAWREVMLRWGIALTWITTPQMPPWHHYISGDYRKLRIEVPNDVVVDVVRSAAVENTGGNMMEGGNRETKDS